MTEVRKFSLIPFPGECNAAGIRIEGAVVRQANLLSVYYEIQGSKAEIVIPSAEAVPARKERLWEKTCLELFAGAAGSARYWEFNFSPGGSWNAYSFTSYREGMKEEQAFSSLRPATRIGPDALRLSLDLDIGKIIGENEPLEVAVCAIVKSVKGGTSHWALAHPAPRPDFHHRDGFRLFFPGPVS